MNYKLTTFLLIAGTVSTFYCVNHQLLEKICQSQLSKKASDTIRCIQYTLHHNDLLENLEISPKRKDVELKLWFKNSTGQNSGNDHSAGSCS